MNGVTCYVLDKAYESIGILIKIIDPNETPTQEPDTTPTSSSSPGTTPPATPTPTPDPASTDQPHNLIGSYELGLGKLQNGVFLSREQWLGLVGYDEALRIYDDGTMVIERWGEPFGHTVDSLKYERKNDGYHVAGSVYAFDGERLVSEFTTNSTLYFVKTGTAADQEENPKVTGSWKLDRIQKNGVKTYLKELREENPERDERITIYDNAVIFKSVNGEASWRIYSISDSSVNRHYIVDQEDYRANADGSLDRWVSDEAAYYEYIPLSWVYSSEIPVISDHQAATMKTLVIPEGTKRIEKGAFEGTDAERILFPEGLESIESRAFADCRNLRYVKMPKGVVDIADDAFENCAGVFAECVIGTSSELYCKGHNFQMIRFKK